LAGTEFIADDFDPVGVLLVQRFASDFRDLDIGIESHVFHSLVTIGLKMTMTLLGQRRLRLVPQARRIGLLVPMGLV